MSPTLVAVLLGLFAVPLALLWSGHQLRRRPPRAQTAFWGAVLGHCVAAVLAVTWAMLPPEAFTSEETLRGAAGWSLLVLPLVGAAVGALRARTVAR